MPVFSYRAQSEAKDNQELLTDQYIKLQMTKGRFGGKSFFVYFCLFFNPTFTISN